MNVVRVPRSPTVISNFPCFSLDSLVLGNMWFDVLWSMDFPNFPLLSNFHPFVVGEHTLCDTGRFKRGTFASVTCSLPCTTPPRP